MPINHVSKIFGTIWTDTTFKCYYIYIHDFLFKKRHSPLLISVFSQIMRQLVDVQQGTDYYRCVYNLLHTSRTTSPAKYTGSWHNGSHKDMPPWRGMQGTWWRHQIETLSALLTLRAWNAPVTGEVPSQRPVTRSFDVFFDLCLNKRFSKPDDFAGDLRRHRTHYDVAVMTISF